MLEAQELFVFLPTLVPPRFPSLSSCVHFCVFWTQEREETVGLAVAVAVICFYFVSFAFVSFSFACLLILLLFASEKETKANKIINTNDIPIASNPVSGQIFFRLWPTGLLEAIVIKDKKLVKTKESQKEEG